MVPGRVYEMAPSHVQVAIIQQYIVVPAKKGFYVLNYGAPEDITGEYQVVFEKAVESFKPEI